MSYRCARSVLCNACIGPERTSRERGKPVRAVSQMSTPHAASIACCGCMVQCVFRSAADVLEHPWIVEQCDIDREDSTMLLSVPGELSKCVGFEQPSVLCVYLLHGRPRSCGVVRWLNNNCLFDGDFLPYPPTCRYVQLRRKMRKAVTKIRVMRAISTAVVAMSTSPSLLGS